MTLQLTGNYSLGSPLLSLSGGVSTRFSWSPFGETAQRDGDATALPGFNGVRADPLTGVSHLGNGYRAYSPALHRFTCPDSESPFGVGGINPYAYCEGDPINNTDPSGHGLITLMLRIITRVAVRLSWMLETTAGTVVSTSLKIETGLALASLATTGIAAGVAKAQGHTKVAQSLGWSVLGQVGGFVVGATLGHLFQKTSGLIKKVVRPASTISDPENFRLRQKLFCFENIPGLDPDIELTRFTKLANDFNGEGSSLLDLHGTLTADGKSAQLFEHPVFKEKKGATGIDDILDILETLAIDLAENRGQLDIVTCEAGGFTQDIPTLGDELSAGFDRTVITYGTRGKNASVGVIERAVLTFLHKGLNKNIFRVRMLNNELPQNKVNALKNKHHPDRSRDRLSRMIYNRV
ncbi:hypothetical protein C3432_01115 [Citrobacter amalonaticus]|uniref:RHS repeat-associated core domain-containing protein n=1 Tax=Citrobacter amalonaticus TaxID=35703 RepID=A0A2S4S245_CITAM|nr:RHS repeat-associated core domain-containing protein [Citrobacter amalonaticus]POT59362.1 hypothetical protein C3432_01115 [Citrobacter amalonaticus]POT77492.1 hypothetical protein C3436_08785 [Citrobacter amalonaticus]POU67944.1 hypothetical protein C3430_02320 [Citrobacter amalonaticus]POV07548.1 hypothetical protein C3424_02330 [Citrobacter amalonaticus]